MNATRLFGLTALATLATLALLATGSASATELCKAAEDPCEVENVYEAGTMIKASSEKALFETSLGTITCTSSALEGENSVSAGSPLPALFGKLSFGSCKLEAASCTAETSELPYYALIEKTGTNVASLELLEEASAPLTVLLKCSGKKEISCTLKNEKMGLELKGGKPAQVVASKEAFEKASGASCPEKTSLTVTYSVSAPESLQIAARGTKLCETSLTGGTTCPGGNAFSGAVQGYLFGTNVVKIASRAGAAGVVTCTEAPFSGSFGQSGQGEISDFKLKSPPNGLCTSTLAGGTPTVAFKFERLPADNSSFAFLQAEAPQGNLVMAGTRNQTFTMAITGNATCEYRLDGGFRVTNPVFATAILEPILGGTLISGSTMVCPGIVAFEGQWDFEGGGSQNIWMGQN